jgi:hypothetical protein
MTNQNAKVSNFLSLRGAKGDEAISEIATHLSGARKDKKVKGSQ